MYLAETSREVNEINPEKKSKTIILKLLRIKTLSQNV